MSAMTPYENVDAIATTTPFAQEEQLQSIADLRRARRFTLGARPEFEKPVPGARGTRRGVWPDQRATSARSRSASSTRLSTTARPTRSMPSPPTRSCSSGDYQVLDDPELLFGSQNVVMVVGDDELERVGQETFLEVVDSVNRLLTQDVMVDLNAVVTEGQDEADVAERFLREAGSPASRSAAATEPTCHSPRRRHPPGGRMPDSATAHPFGGVTDLFSELNRMRDVGVHGREHAHEDTERTHASAWVPATDIVARGDDLVIRVEVAGLAPEASTSPLHPRDADRLGQRRTELGTAAPTTSTCASASTAPSGAPSRCPRAPTTARSPRRVRQRAGGDHRAGRMHRRRAQADPDPRHVDGDDDPLAGVNRAPVGAALSPTDRARAPGRSPPTGRP